MQSMPFASSSISTSTAEHSAQTLHPGVRMKHLWPASQCATQSGRADNPPPPLSRS